MPPYVIYARKSTDSEDRQVVSIESQVKELQLLAARQNITVVEVLTESRSAKHPGRPVFGEMMRRIHRGQIRGILCWKMDRLARNHLDHGAILQALADKLLEQIVTTDRPYTPDGTDRFIGNFELGMATKYSDDLSQNVKRGIRARLERGWVNHTPRLGYLMDPMTKEILEDPERFELVARLLRLTLGGAMRPARALKVATEQWHLRTRTTKRRPGGPLARSAFFSMLGDPFYAGLIRLRDGRTYPGSHRPMITMEEFHRLQEILGRPDRSRPKRHEFAFVGLFTCGSCGAAVTAEEHVKPSGRRYVYYRCSHRKVGADCREPAISEHALIAQVVAVLRTLRMPLPIHDWLCRKALEEQDREVERARLVKATVERAAKDLDREAGNLLDLRTRELITDEVFVAKQQQFEERRVALRERLASLKAGSQDGPQLVRVFTLAARAAEVLQRGTPVQQRTILQAVGLNYRLQARRVAFSLIEPFPRLALAGSLSNWSGCLDDVRTLVDEGLSLERFADVLECIDRSHDDELGENFWGRYVAHSEPHRLSQRESAA